jgi:hypothetical protein
MTLKTRVVTRAVDLTLEGESVEDLRKIVKFLREEQLVPEVGGAPALPPRSPRSSRPRSRGSDEGGPTRGTLSPPPSLSPVFKVNDRTGEVAALKAKLIAASDQPERTTDAALVLLLGKAEAGEVPTYGTSLMRALRRTGYTMARIDRPLESYIGQGLVLTSGTKKSRAYQLTEAGRTRAKEILKELASAMGVAS